MNALEFSGAVFNIIIPGRFSTGIQNKEAI